MLSFLLWAFVAYVMFGGILFGCQRSLLYHPNQTVPDPAEFGLTGIEVLRIEVDEGYKLLAWWRRPEKADGAVVVYFHGNAGHLGHRADKIRPFIEAGYGVLLVSYRYNADAGGSPSEEGLYADGRSVIDFVRGKGISPESIAVYGESLGTAVAVTMASEHNVGAVILESPYTSIADVAQSHYWYLPAKLMIWDKFDAIGKIEDLNAPLLVIHGERDAIIPIEFGQRIYDKATDPKEAHFIPQAGHNDLYAFGAGDRAVEFLKRHLSDANR